MHSVRDIGVILQAVWLRWPGADHPCVERLLFSLVVEYHQCGHIASDWQPWLNKLSVFTAEMNRSRSVDIKSAQEH